MVVGTGMVSMDGWFSTQSHPVKTDVHRPLLCEKLWESFVVCVCVVVCVYLKGLIQFKINFLSFDVYLFITINNTKVVF